MLDTLPGMIMMDVQAVRSQRSVQLFVIRWFFRSCLCLCCCSLVGSLIRSQAAVNYRDRKVFY